MPARSMSRWLAICASAGVSRRMGRKYLVRRMAGWAPALWPRRFRRSAPTTQSRGASPLASRHRMRRLGRQPLLPGGPIPALGRDRPVLLLVPGGILDLDPARDQPRDRPGEDGPGGDRPEDRQPAADAEAQDQDD